MRVGTYPGGLGGGDLDNGEGRTGWGKEGGLLRHTKGATADTSCRGAAQAHRRHLEVGDGGVEEGVARGK